MKIKQFHVKNQFILSGYGFEALQSYQSIIVLHTKGETYIGKDWDYSNTTGKYRNRFLGESKNETLKKIKSGKYKLADLDNPNVFNELTKMEE